MSLFIACDDRTDDGAVFISPSFPCTGDAEEGRGGSTATGNRWTRELELKVSDRPRARDIVDAGARFKSMLNAELWLAVASCDV